MLLWSGLNELSVLMYRLRELRSIDADKTGCGYMRFCPKRNRNPFLRIICGLVKREEIVLHILNSFSSLTRGAGKLNEP